MKNTELHLKNHNQYFMMKMLGWSMIMNIQKKKKDLDFLD